MDDKRADEAMVVFEAQMADLNKQKILVPVGMLSAMVGLIKVIVFIPGIAKQISEVGEANGGSLGPLLTGKYIVEHWDEFMDISGLVDKVMVEYAKEHGIPLNRDED